MLLFPVWVSALLGLLVGFLPLLGTEPLGGSKPATDPQQPSSCDSNCSQLTLKLEFSSKVVEDGKNPMKHVFSFSSALHMVSLMDREREIITRPNQSEGRREGEETRG